MADPVNRRAAVIDPVLDYDHKDGSVDVRSVEAILQAAQDDGLTIEWALETHAHADHLSGAPYIKAKTGAMIGIGEHIKDVQRIFRPIFNAKTCAPTAAISTGCSPTARPSGSANSPCEALYTPGHTPADLSYQIGDAVFVGDTLFMPDYGTARADFPGGDARQLYRSIQRLLALPPDTRLFMCHDYKAPGRDVYAWETTVREQRDGNVHLRGGVTEDDFVAMRTARDATLSAPTLLLPSIQVNIRAGRFPKAQQNGVSYLLLPVHAKAGAEAGIAS